MFWNLNTQGPNNPNQIFTPTDLSGTFPFSDLQDIGMDYDSQDDEFYLWDGSGDTWILKPPSTISTQGWTITENPPPVNPSATVAAIAPEISDGNLGSTSFTGVLGKWQYAASLGVFLGVIDPTSGTIWAYKPEDWTPNSAAPVVTTANLTGVSLTPGQTYSAANFAMAGDPDGDALNYEFVQAAASNTGFFLLNGVAQQPGTIANVTPQQLAADDLLWVAGQAGTSAQVALTVSDTAFNSTGANLVTPVVSGSANSMNFSGLPTGVNVNLASGAVLVGGVQVETLSGVTNIVGTALADTLTGAAGNDTLDGGGGGDLLVGGGANNTYIFDHGYGTETIEANVAVSTKNDTVQFGPGITDDELWFSQSGNDLDVSLIGTTDSVVVQNWFASSAAQVQQFETADGNVLMQSQVQNLVSAMASFGPPPSSSSGFGTTVPTQLEPVIAANWHPAVS
jgi:hypothetical protein